MQNSEIQRITNWLIDGARSSGTPSEMIAEVCEHLVAAGLPLSRFGIFIRTLHPEIFGRNFIWRQGQKVEIGTVDFEILDTPEFARSPLRIVFEEGLEVRGRMDDPDSKRFPFLDDMRAEGVTDYLAMPMHYLDGIRKSGSSIGAVLEIVAEGVPAGLGAPIYAKLDSDLAGAMMTINAVKGVEIGAGFGAAELTGEENADEMRTGNDGTRFLSNHAGGILGGISTGQPVVVRFAVKPTSSILQPRLTVDRQGADTEIMTKGRHDPCVGIRAVPVGEAMMACVLADHFLRDRGQVGR
jgi:hypothetical protein